MRHLDLEVSVAASAVDSEVVVEASVGVVGSEVVTVSDLVEESATKAAVMDSVVEANRPPTLHLVPVVAAGEISEAVEETLVVAGETSEVEALTVVVVDSTVEVAATGSLCAHEMALRTATAATTVIVIATETATAVMTAMEETATGTVIATDMVAEMPVEMVAEMLAETAAGRTLDGSDPVKTMATMTLDPGDGTKCSPSCEWMLLSPFSALACRWVSPIWPSRAFLFSRVMG